MGLEPSGTLDGDKMTLVVLVGAVFFVVVIFLVAVLGFQQGGSGFVAGGQAPAAATARESFSDFPASRPGDTAGGVVVIQNGDGRP
ncbi:hypothetical protein [Aestuariicoccus sp. MJ-SS9]|uniref:hypothetical protein n=1 Tax=Aestuariicoccus sp. MJ-SS9 TaxID=3079855 RepID=UPI00291204AC|nr:hypothetical protein [Aestuariicoccus sp. MJ-SS9]MDU8910802.1 hypothetical protein [Aestuariicoccus sp. MJ-SS9]